MNGLLFEVEEDWRQHWRDMPEFVQEDASPVQQIIVSFATQEDVIEFGKLLGQKVRPTTKSLWYPAQNNIKPKHYRYVTEE